MAKKIILWLNVAALVVAIVWYVGSGFDLEPCVTSITLLATLIGQLTMEVIARIKKQSVIIKGDNNKAIQKTTSTDTDTTQKVRISGKGNESTQEQ